MTRSSTLILGSLTAILLAACGGPEHDTTTTGGTGVGDRRGHQRPRARRYGDDRLAGPGATRP